MEQNRETVSPKTLVNLLRLHADHDPTEISLLSPDRAPMTRGRLIRQIDDTVARLNALGVSRSDRVAMVLPDGPEMATAFLGVSAAAICSPFNPAWRAHEIEVAFEALHPAALLALVGSQTPAVAVARQSGIPVLELIPTPGETGVFTLSGPSHPSAFGVGTTRVDDPILVLHTSGTSAQPKLVLLTHRNIVASARAIGTVLELTPADRCLSVMPLSHIHGLSAIFASLVAGGSVVCPSGFSAEAFFDWLDEYRPTWYTAAPTIHRAIVDEAHRHPGRASHSSLRFVRSASSAMPRELAVELEEVFQVPFIEAYGMTEAAPQIASNRLPPHIRKPGSVGKAAGPDIAILDENGHVMAANERGEITIRGENVCTPDWLRTGDLGYLDEDRDLFVTGRLKDVIDRGGEKIVPQEVEAAILAHESVREAAAFGVPHPTLGESVAAAVTLREGAVATAGAIRQFVSKRISPFKVPHPILVIDAIPHGPGGKLQRAHLAERLGLAGMHSAPKGSRPDESMNEVETRVLATVVQTLGIKELRVHDDFFLAGGDSLSATQVIARLRDVFGIDLSPDSLFDQPTVAELAAHIETRLADARVVVIPRRRPGDPLQISLGQQRLWLLDQLDPGNPAYNMQVALRWSGSLDLDALEQSLTEIQTRHEVLRTTFPSINGEPTVRVADPSPFRLRVVDLSRLLVDDRKQDLRRLLIEERAKSFHLAEGPLFQPLLVHLGARDHVVVLGMHHIVSDGWSTSVLIRELQTLYASFVEGRSSPLPELPFQYSDFAAWQRSMLDDNGNRELQLEHWREALRDLRTTLDLPTDRPRPATQTFRGAEWDSTLGRETVARLKTLGREEGATLFMTMLAAFQTLLLRYSGQEDIAVGIPIANRAHASTEDLIGFFANTLVMRGDLSGDPAFRAYLHRVRLAARDAFFHQDLPFEDVVEAVRPTRDASRSPLFQVMFAFQNYPRAAGPLTPDVEVAHLPVAPSSTKFDLTLYLSETPDGLSVAWQYCTDLFDERTIVEMAESYEALLESILANPDCRLSALPLLGRTQRAAPFVAPSEVAARKGMEPRFNTLFEAQAERTPEAIAVRSVRDQLTYRALNERAGALASRLRLCGVGPGALVGVCLRRSVDALVALLGVWKAGGAYLPIDYTHPRERSEFILDDAHVSVLVTERALREALPPAGLPIVFVDNPGDDPVGSHDVDAEAPEAESELAYVIYTSGSAGQPKGVMISHRNVSYYVGAMREALGIASDDRYLHTASFAFSSAMRQFLLPLSCGATVVIASSEDLRDPLALLEWIRHERITVADLVPSYWRQMVRLLTEQPSAARTAKLENDVRLLLSASEPLLSDLPATWAGLGHRARLVNMYGQTETTGIVTVHRIPSVVGDEVSRVPAGRPIPGTSVNILDSTGQPVPVGVVGELVVRGPGVGLGYIGRPEETAERFAADPLDGVARLAAYRTGDRARRLHDGTIVVLGRIDDQMKLRGFRIEPGEIEVVLKAHPRVDECAVVVRRDQSGEDRLVAYVVRSQNDPIHPDEGSLAMSLRAYLKTKLPDYMVPATILEIDRLPLTPTGKVGRRALPAPEMARRVIERSPITASPSAEGLLTEIASRLLDVEKVGVDDNFFDLGGDSMIGLRLVDEANRAGLALTPKQLFQYQTIGGLARVASAPRTESLDQRAAADSGQHDARLERVEASTDRAVRVTIESLRAFGEEALTKAGLSMENASKMTDVQVEASLRGQPTHNVGAIPRYARRLTSGAIKARPEFRIERETAVSALLDGDNGPGQLVALAAMDLAMSKAAAIGIGVVGVRHSNHFGAAGHYVWQAAQRNLIGLCTTNSALWLAPTGGLTPLFGTNPLAVGIPSGKHYPIILDISMSVTAKGKVALELEEGRPLQPGWILDRSGRTSVDPADLVAGLGVPIGEHKGYGLALVMEVLGGVLTGAGFGLDHRRERMKQKGNHADFGHFFIAIDPRLFMSTAEFESRVDRMIVDVKGAKRIEGVKEILLPGEAEMRARDRNLREGLPLLPSNRQALEKYRREAGLHSEIVIMKDLVAHER